MANFGFKIAKKGYSITAADRYMRVTSKYPVLKLKASGIGTGVQTAGNGGFTVEITHNLGYKPICRVTGQYYDLDTTQVITKYSKWNRWLYRGLQVADLYYYYADTTKLYINCNLSYLTDAYSFNLGYMYHIYYDEDTL